MESEWRQIMNKWFVDWFLENRKLVFNLQIIYVIRDSQIDQLVYRNE